MGDIRSSRASLASNDKTKYSPLNDGENEKEKLDLDSKKESKCRCSVKCFMICKTVALVGVWICMGMRMFIEFTTIPNMRLRLNTDVEGLSYALSFGAIGGLIAAPFVALADRYGGHSDIITSGLLIFGAIFNTLKPYCTSLTVFALCDLMQEMAWAVIPSIGDSVVTSMWGAKSGPPLHSVHTGYTIGATLAPFIVSAFVPEVTGNSQHGDTSASSFNMATGNESTIGYNSTMAYETHDEPMVDNSNIEYAYIINAALMVFIACIFLIFEFIPISMDSQKTQSAKKPSYNWSAIFKPSIWGDGIATKGILVFLAMNLFYICHLGALKGPTMLLTTYALDSDLNFTSAEAVRLSSGASLGGLIARGILIVASGYFSVNSILLVCIHGQLLGSLCLALFGTSSKTMLWVFSCAYGAIVRPIWAAGYQWANDYIILVAFHFGMSRMLTRIVDIGQNALQGYLYSNVTKESAFYTAVVYAVINCLVLYFMLLIGRHYGNRHVKDKTETIEMKS